MTSLPSLTTFDIGLAIKIVELAIAAIFIIFSLLTIRQVAIMNRSVITSLGPEIKIAAYVQMAASTIVLILILIF